MKTSSQIEKKKIKMETGVTINLRETKSLKLQEKISWTGLSDWPVDGGVSK